jgi:hypothetical protein
MKTSALYPSGTLTRTDGGIYSASESINDTITNNKEVIILFGCQQLLIHTDKDTQAIIEYICS